jgi:hypothetical protein
VVDFTGLLGARAFGYARPTLSSGEERRRHPRYDVSGLAGVLDGFRAFEALKLSVGGMLVRLPVELAMDQPVRVELALGDDTFRSRAHVVFMGPDSERSPEGGERFRVGLAFVDPSPADRAKVARYIEDTLLLAP